MNKSVVFGIAIIFVVIGISCLDVARADALKGPPIGKTASFGEPLIVCHTEKQIEAIVEAGRNDPKKLVAKFMEFSVRKNSKHQPLCVQAKLSAVTFVESKALGDMLRGGHQSLATWAVRVANPQISVWMIYAAPKMATKVIKPDSDFDRCEEGTKSSYYDVLSTTRTLWCT